jgi:RNA recognition motif-containing protein
MNVDPSHLTSKTTVLESTARISHSGFVVPYTTVTESDNHSVYLRNVAFHSTKDDLIRYFQDCGEMWRLSCGCVDGVKWRVFDGGV